MKGRTVLSTLFLIDSVLLLPQSAALESSLGMDVTPKIFKENGEFAMVEKDFIEAKKNLLAGELEIEKKNYAGAIEYFRRGISLLKNDYVSNLSIDDTGVKMILADKAEREEKLDICAGMLRNVLFSRIKMYQMKIDEQKNRAALI